MKILLLNGPNLNMLGKREVDVYGRLSLADVHHKMFSRASKLGVSLLTFQSNNEGEIVEAIHGAFPDISGLIINPAAYTHTSVAIRDALLILDIPIIEVHLSNIHNREPFRRFSMISDIVNGHISGLGVMGYLLALDAIVQLCA